MTTLNQLRAIAAFILSEANGHRSRGNAVIAEQQTIKVGQVLGKVGANEGAVAVGDPAFTGVGDGTLTKAASAFGAGVQEGIYVIRLVEAGLNAGEFEVIRPDGTIDGHAAVGVAYDGQVKFTIADGATDFAAAAQFTLAVAIAAAADEGLFKALNLLAADGAEIAAAIALYDVTTGAGETAAVAAIVRDAEINGNELEWPAGITADQKAAAIAQLAASGIIVR